MYSKLVFALVAFLNATIWIGCDDEQKTDCMDCGESWWPSVQIVTGTPNDTLYFVPGDSVSTSLTIIVTDSRGRAYPGQPVDIALSDPSIGVIEFLDPLLQDTTNEIGRVNTVFRSYGMPGIQTIIASAGGRTDSQTLVITETSDPVNRLTLLATPTMLEADEDDIAISSISATIVDANNRGIQGRRIAFSASDGELTEALPTDQNGRTRCYWIAEDLAGEFYIRAQVGGLADSVRVSVTDNPGLPSLYIMTSSVYFEADSSVELNILVTARLNNSFGEGIANAQILLSETGGLAPDSCSTSGSGFCQFVWTFQNDFGIFQLAAEYEPWGLRDTLLVEIDYSP